LLQKANSKTVVYFNNFNSRLPARTTLSILTPKDTSLRDSAHFEP